MLIELDLLGRQLWKVDENLCRAGLSPAEEAQHLSRRKQLHAARQERLRSLDCELHEIDTTLKRPGLGKAEQAAAVQRRQWVAGTRARLEALGGQSSASRPQHEKGFASETAEKTGISKSTINQAIARAE